MHTHGLFGACIDTGLDQNESELIRQQVHVHVACWTHEFSCTCILYMYVQ